MQYSNNVLTYGGVLMNDPKQAEQVQARKAWAFFSVLAGMGQFAAFAARAVTTGKPRKYSAAYTAVAPARKPRSASIRHRGPSPEHVAAVSLMREARRLKRMARAEDALSEKRRRQAGQLQRHARAIARRTKALPLCPPHAVVPAPHFLYARP